MRTASLKHSAMRNLSDASLVKMTPCSHPSAAQKACLIVLTAAASLDPTARLEFRHVVRIRLGTDGAGAGTD